MSEKMGLQEKTPLWEDNNFITSVPKNKAEGYN